MSGMFKNTKINIFNLIISGIISIVCTVKIYGFLYNKLGWNNLPDFYVGVSIYNNHNKYLDLSVYFIYLILFFILYILLNYLFFSNKFLNREINIDKSSFNKSECSHPVFHKFVERIKQIKIPLKRILCKYQFFALLGYIFLYPFNGKFYPVIVLVILTFIITGIIDIIKRKGESFSPWAIAPFIFIFCFNPYFNQLPSFDDHHMGEKVAAFVMHDKYNMEYYKDIMLVHGFRDVLPSMTAKYIFGSFSIYNSLLCEVFFNNIFIIFSAVTLMYLFNNCILMALPVIMIPADNFTKLYFLTYIIFLEKIFNVEQSKIYI